MLATAGPKFFVHQVGLRLDVKVFFPKGITKKEKLRTKGQKNS